MKQLFSFPRLTVVLTLATFSIFTMPAVAVVTQIAVTGQDIPDGNGKFGPVLNLPVINNVGKVAFRAELSNTLSTNDNVGVYSYSSGSLAKVVRENESPPEGNGVYSGFSTPLINAAGQIGFGATHRTTSSPPFDTSGLYMHNGTTIVNVARDNDTEPENNGVFDDLSLEVFNSGGRFAFSNTLRNTSGGTLDDSGVFRYDGSALQNIIRKNVLVPNTNGRFLTTADRALNALGQVAFQAQLSDTAGGGIDDSAIYLTGIGLFEVVREDALVPEGGGRYDLLFGPGINSAGQVAFFANLRDTPLASDDDSGIYLWSQAAGFKNVARENSAPPEGNGVFHLLGDSSRVAEGVVLGAHDQVVFHATLRNTSGGSTDDEGIYLFNVASLSKIARENDTVPGGNGKFASFGTPVINALGHIAFRANLKDTSGLSSDDQALYLFNGTTLVQAAREGDVIGTSQLGGSPFIADGSGGQDGRASGLNDLDQIAFQASLTTGGSGVFLFTPGMMPDPTLPGDYNDNDIVDAADYVVWRDNLDTSNTIPNDATPGSVNQADYGVWQANFGRSLASGTGNLADGLASVPEPSGGLPIVLAMASLGFLRTGRV